MPLATSHRLPRAIVVLLAMCGVVHGSLPDPTRAETKRQAQVSTTPRANEPVQVRYGTDSLPQPVIEMRDAILAAVRSGRIEEIVGAIELNEIKPAFGEVPASDPVAWLKQASADGQGRDILAALANVLDAGYAVVRLGRDAENNTVYVWPHFAETGVASLTSEREVELLRLVPADRAKAMREAGKYDFWRLGIGADGVWHFLRK